MTTQLLGRTSRRSGRVAIGRASDYFGPALTTQRSAKPSSVQHFPRRTAQVMGDPDTLHCYSYTPDVPLR